MRHYDMTPLYRSTIGFDQLFNQLFDSVGKLDSAGYPPYNIESSGDNTYRITLAVAGFSEDDIDVELREQTLTITGAQSGSEVEGRSFLHQGIAGRNFERRFQLAEHVKIIEASLNNGLLHIDLEREIPEAHKPRKIKITKGLAGQAAKILKAPNAA